MIDTLAAIVGAPHVSTDIGTRALAGADLFPAADAVVPDVVVRPADTAQVAAVVAALAGTPYTIVPRGAGLSYSGGVVPRTPSIVLDLTRLDRVQVAPDDLYAVVGAGCTWQRLVDALRPHRLRATQSSPISGSHSTIGGAASQNVPGSMDGFVGLEVVLADGSVVRTGSWALPGRAPFYRNAGPDLTGVFLGDCGAFGVKTEIVLRLVPEPACAFASFAFDTGADALNAMVALQRAGLVTRCVAMDRARADSAGQVGTGEALRTAAAVASRAGSVRAMIGDLAGLRRGRDAAAQAAWSLHLIVESATQQGASAQLNAVRALCGAGQEIPPAVPQALHARPYSVRGFVGPAGERWVPVHGLLPLTRAAETLTQLENAVQARADALAAATITVNWLISSQGAYVLFEPMFYWPDALDPIHMKYLSDRNRVRFADFTRNDVTRTLVAEMRDALRDVMDRNGAVHMQVGRYYASSAGLLERIKAAVDPAGKMNAGVLGLGSDTRAGNPGMTIKP